MASTPKNFRIWDGIQDEWPEEKAEEGFGDPAIIERIKGRVRQSVKACGNNEPDPQTSIYNQYPLPLLISVMAAEGKVSVLDFGGGMGQTFLATKATACNLDNLSYYVLEFEDLLKAGRELFYGSSQVHFISGFDEAPGHVDIVFAGAAFQYVDKWEDILRKFASFAPRYIVFGNLLAGDIKPLVTFQNNWGHRIPVRFHNFNEIVRALEKLEYKLIFDAYHEQTILGERQPLPLKHFPDDRRLLYGRNVIFRKS